MKPDAHPRPRLPYLLTRRRATTGAGSLRCERRVGRPWCEHCGTSHRDPVVVAECIRLLVDGPDWPDMGS